jgi:hypothetical protein
MEAPSQLCSGRRHCQLDESSAALENNIPV